ncbi:UNKNOWN [Stylonychia lemnae]|uniref:Uncharacterized protein n=1 Tax=Stylonychia lemnae TaxID=5949 RepID=A0A078B4N4_STYLE|nr:UNKNOWN [Stylonychia lemnae]|eukprot:CDW89495.1 UNKNOWN [Stylonychia lemnae]
MEDSQLIHLNQVQNQNQDCLDSTGLPYFNKQIRQNYVTLEQDSNDIKANSSGIDFLEIKKSPTKRNQFAQIYDQKEEDNKDNQQSDQYSFNESQRVQLMDDRIDFFESSLIERPFAQPTIISQKNKQKNINRKSKISARGQGTNAQSKKSYKDCAKNSIEQQKDSLNIEVSKLSSRGNPSPRMTINQMDNIEMMLQNTQEMIKRRSLYHQRDQSFNMRGDGASSHQSSANLDKITRHQNIITEDINRGMIKPVVLKDID